MPGGCCGVSRHHQRGTIQNAKDAGDVANEIQQPRNSGVRLDRGGARDWALEKLGSGHCGPPSCSLLLARTTVGCWKPTRRAPLRQPHLKRRYVSLRDRLRNALLIAKSNGEAENRACAVGKPRTRLQAEGNVVGYDIGLTGKIAVLSPLAHTGGAGHSAHLCGSSRA